MNLQKRQMLLQQLKLLLPKLLLLQVLSDLLGIARQSSMQYISGRSDLPTVGGWCKAGTSGGCRGTTESRCWSDWWRHFQSSWLCCRWAHGCWQPSRLCYSCNPVAHLQHSIVARVRGGGRVWCLHRGQLFLRTADGSAMVSPPLCLEFGILRPRRNRLSSLFERSATSGQSPQLGAHPQSL